MLCVVFERLTEEDYMPEKQKDKTRCENCNMVFLFNEEDMVKITSEDEEYFTVVCPHCGRDNVFTL